jgi:hypothetical protein
MEDARGAQTIHLQDLSTSTRQEDQDGISEKAIPYDEEHKGNVLVQLKQGSSPGEGGNMDAARQL